MKEKIPSVKIFITYHKPYQLLKSNILTPLHVGRSVTNLQSKDHQPFSERELQYMKDNMIGDDTGDNISHRNRNYCELTGIYWAWKNYEKIGNPDYIGFMHYRRHFIFNENVHDLYIPQNNDEKAYSNYTVGNIYDGYIDYFGLTDEKIVKYCMDYDCIIPKKCELKYVGISSIREDYTSRIEGTKKNDFDLLLRTVKKMAPDYYEIIVKRASMSDKNCFHSFILKRNLFFDYCAFLFGLLDILDKEIDTAYYSINGQRTLGYLGELLFDCYMHKLRKSDAIMYKELGLTHICIDSIPYSIKKKTAILLLSFSDYESLEISLASYSKFFSPETKLFILQNGRGSYDCERTYRVALRYENLFPHNIKVIDFIPPSKPYFAIRELINSKVLEEFEYICKVDDDTFPITPDWLDKLCDCYEYYFARYGNNLAYVTPLINNNPFGFVQLLKNNKVLNEEYFSRIAIDHKVGANFVSDDYRFEQIIPKTEVSAGMCGTIWRYSYIARWLHENTTLKPDYYIGMTSFLGDTELPDERYSINCMLFKKQYWNDIGNASMSDDDEHLSFMFCKNNNKKIIARQSVPFIHLFFFSQREENKDITPVVRELYQQRLNTTFPIAVCSNKEYELEARLRFLESKINLFCGVRKKQSMFELIKKNIMPLINLLAPNKSKRRTILKSIYYQFKS